MANTKKSELHAYRSLDDQQLADQIAEEEVRMKKTQFSHAVNPIENPLTIRTMRRNIARMKTEANKRKSGK